MSNKKQRYNINGWLVVDKPLGISSARVVAVVKRLTNAKKVGHGGTLDPLASGILPLALGEATKAMQFVVDHSKTYEFTVQLGAGTNTDDLEGEIDKTNDVRPTLAEIEAILPEFIGEVGQKPPAFSAIKIDGKRAYNLARKGREFEIPERTITIHDLVLLSHDAENNTITLRAHCGKGTYIRSLARDLAIKLGTFGHVIMLRRTKVGKLDEKCAVSLAMLEELVDSALPSEPEVLEALADNLLPVQTVLDDIPVLPIDEETSTRLRNGLQAYVPNIPLDSKVIATFNEDKLHSICSIADERYLKPERVFNL
jgi:tRNA pseudouridine55 synthase